MHRYWSYKSAALPKQHYSIVNNGLFVCLILSRDNGVRTVGSEVPTAATRRGPFDNIMKCKEFTEQILTLPARDMRCTHTVLANLFRLSTDYRWLIEYNETGYWVKLME
jgi:hypothetical protein